ncbi:hypothetical protein BDP55DRAFT_627855 [Colletotrichum godetiae]|uniref:Zn(2)-C6 fungal-type domain-containing protein n=1 Tax=Colletotrichum godetiae TaxID=1209918 RepID=A0AAJ0ATN3_9PEZI|nr:uncharacterized protein BDP55DRAFT_627855 [Colletotrichum godetiae]KAK1690157.1 hypothetical protein BDP55DRAFT_627855 [Colletotrichum godetiae]
MDPKVSELPRAASNDAMLSELTPRPATDKPPNKPRQKTANSRRQKTFTGCWTCRERHVRCDEQRPACRRCVAGKFACQGYGTRLTWLSSTGQGTPKSSGRRRSRTKASPSSQNLTQFPSQEMSPAIDVQQIGSFPASRSCEWRHGVEYLGQADGSTAAMNQLSRDVRSSGLVTGTPQERYATQCDSFGASNQWDTMLMGSPTRPVEALSNPARERELISHWATNLAHKLIPIRSPANPFLTVVSPIALEGSRLANTRSTSTVALFHAVCAISAAHQANLRGTHSHSSYTDLMLRHKQLSFHHLMQNMSRRDHDERMASLATLCLWILTHFITGTAGAWREVIKVTRNLLDDTSMQTWRQSNTAALTYESFSSAFATVLAQYLGRLDAPVPLKTGGPRPTGTRIRLVYARAVRGLRHRQCGLGYGTPSPVIILLCVPALFQG